MRSVGITLSSMALTSVVLGNAYYQKKQFYPSVVYITKSNPSMAVCVWPLDLEVRKWAARYWLGKGKLDKVIELTTNGISTKEDIREILLQEWQADWEECTTGHGPYRASLFRMNLSETSLCCCGGEATPEHVTLECIFTEREKAELLMPIQANAMYYILRDVDHWSYLDEIADRVLKSETDRHMDELKERRQRQDQD
uniref:E3 ubiquitin-protein ligase synoviolin-like TPR repeats domain-containing protein n=1 Tax=Timema tahoe TaxID=61484 RepID=A0A7R9IF36_9NEOP|nr:unnamed protein product [Timema tahoe]